MYSPLQPTCCHVCSPAVLSHCIVQLLLQTAVQPPQQRSCPVRQAVGIRCKSYSAGHACFAHGVLHCCCEGRLYGIQVALVLQWLPLLKDLQVPNKHHCSSGSSSAMAGQRQLAPASAAHKKPVQQLKGLANSVIFLHSTQMLLYMLDKAHSVVGRRSAPA